MIDDIELAASLAEAETGARGAAAKLPLSMAEDEKQKARVWTAEEDAYVREHYGRASLQEIADELGRTFASVLIRVKRELHLVAPSKAPDILTAEQVSWGLGMGCGKSVHKLMDDGLMPHRKLPEREPKSRSTTRIVDRQALLLWMLKPENWVYFRPERVGTLCAQGKRELSERYDFAFWESAHELVMAARSAWKDEWLTPGQVAKELGLKWGSRPINAAIHRGQLKAVRWGNWWIRRSDLPAKGMTINAQGWVRPRVKTKYACPRGMALHVNRSTCMKARLCVEAMR